MRSDCFPSLRFLALSHVQRESGTSLQTCLRFDTPQHRKNIHGPWNHNFVAVCRSIAEQHKTAIIVGCTKHANCVVKTRRGHMSERMCRAPACPRLKSLHAFRARSHIQQIIEERGCRVGGRSITSKDPKKGRNKETFDEARERQRGKENSTGLALVAVHHSSQY